MYILFVCGGEITFILSIQSLFERIYNNKNSVVSHNLLNKY